MNLQNKDASSSAHKQTSSAGTGLTPTLLDQTNRLAEEIGHFIEYWGFKKVHGRMWAHLFLSHTPLDAAELMRRLQISKALVSLSVKELLLYRVIENAGKGPHGTQVYTANLDVMNVILDVLRSREARMLARIESEYGVFLNLLQAGRENQSGLLALSPLDEVRAQKLGDMIRNASAGLKTMLNLGRLNLQEYKF